MKCILYTDTQYTIYAALQCVEQKMREALKGNRQEPRLHLMNRLKADEDRAHSLLKGLGRGQLQLFANILSPILFCDPLLQVQVQLEDQFYKRQRETHLVRGGQDLRAVCFNGHHHLLQCHIHYIIPLFKPWMIFHFSIEDIWIYVYTYIYKVAHTYVCTFLQTISSPPDGVSLYVI